VPKSEGGQEFIKGVHAEKQVLRNPRLKVYDADRTCAVEECATRLSKYNRTKFCWVHEPRKIVTRVRGG
jgi:hypothetical protein